MTGHRPPMYFLTHVYNLEFCILEFPYYYLVGCIQRGSKGDVLSEQIERQKMFRVSFYTDLHTLYTQRTDYT